MEQFEDDLERQVRNLEDDRILLGAIGNLIIAITAVSAGLIIVILMFYTVKERTKEIAVFKALGFTGANVTAQFVLEVNIRL